MLARKHALTIRLPSLCILGTGNHETDRPCDRRSAMNVDNLLSRLQKVRKGFNPNTWQACCPAHQDKSPSLALKALDDGRILLHCFGGCSQKEVTDALGIRTSDLFPASEYIHSTGKPAFSAHDVLRAIAHETQIVAVCGSELSKHPLPKKDHDRLFLAVNRINKALELAGVHDA